MAPAEDPRRHPARTAALTNAVSDVGVARRAFVDATGTSVTMPPAVRRLVATDETVGALLVELGAPLVGCAGVLDGVEAVGDAHRPDPAAVAAARPDVIVVDLADAALAAGLRRVAPVVVVDAARPVHARADLRALLGSAGSG